MIGTEERVSRRAVAWALGFTLLVRLIHLFFALRSPLTFQPGPDEAYYIAFGQDVAHGTGGLQPVFGFMDPLYGYLVGAVLRTTGSLLPLYLLQIALDTATGYALFRIATHLGRPRAGVVAIVLYGVTGTAIAYTASVLKSTCDVAFLTWWMFALLRALDAPGVRRWVAFGAFCGIGVALRSNLLLMTPLALAVAWFCTRRPRRASEWVSFSAAVMAGLALPLALLAARNHASSGGWSPLPTNSGIVLHQLYNEENPEARSAVPSFVGRYTAPFDIWRGYAREAERRAGHPVRAHEVSRYWGREARAYLLAHPAQDARNAIRKLREFSAYPEVPNTRNYGDERLFSPVLRALPLPFGWLFALGVPGLALSLRRDRRTLVLLAPVAMGLATIAVFFAEDRFRFDIISPFVLGAAIWIVAGVDAIRARQWRPLLLGAVASLLLGAWSIAQARLLIPPFPSDWQRITWGYIRSGRGADAERVLREVERTRPEAPGLDELRGFLALRAGQPREAAMYLERAIERRPDVVASWQNLGLALERLGAPDQALAAAIQADVLDPNAENAMRRGDVLWRLGHREDARAQWNEARRRVPSPQLDHMLQARLAGGPPPAG